MAEIMNGITPVYDMNANRGATNGMFGGEGGIMWILVLILLLGGGRGGLFGGAESGLRQELSNEFLYNNLNTTLQNGFTQTGNNFALVNKALCDTQLQLCQGFGAVNHNLDLATCDIKTTIHSEGEATRALINANRLAQLESENNALRADANNANQTNAIISALRPYPTPAFLAPNPAVADAHAFRHWA